MRTNFIHLNTNWNAEPNVPREKIAIQGVTLKLQFFLNHWAYDGFSRGEFATITFQNVYRYRLGETNDEGWYRGQCRFSKLAPAWGEFYQVVGDAKLNECPDDWSVLSPGEGKNHYLFYLRDSTFECQAMSYKFTRNG